MSKHTPGDWYVGRNEHTRCTIYDKFGQRIANSFEGVPEAHRSDDECLANARLIAAAPKLLAACRSALYLLKGREHDQFLRDVIAEATGERP